MHFKTHESAVEEVLKRLRDYKIIEDIEEIREWDIVLFMVVLNIHKLH